jgi:integrative and conjugative element protein (TIGR02256 family)
MSLKLKLPPKVLTKLRTELRRAGSREIGGVLVGEFVEDGVYRVVDVSFQRVGGSAAYFVRDPEHHKDFLADFFRRTGNDYTRFNYIGEWHSHPSFPAVPSLKDVDTAQKIVENPQVGVNFIVLLIVRRRFWGRLEISASLFQHHLPPEKVTVEFEIVRRFI